MPTYTQDSRQPAEWTFLRKSLITGRVLQQKTSTYSKKNGQVKSFSGENSGKFIPGVYRVNGMSASRTSYIYGNGTVKVTHKNSSGKLSEFSEGSGCLLAASSFSAASLRVSNWDSGLMGGVVQRAYSELLSGDLDVGEFLAELPESISMVRGGVSSILSAIAKAKAGGFTWSKVDRARRYLLSGKPYKALPRNLANAWLTWRYGIRPLVWDVQDFIKEANSFALNSNFSGLRRKRARAQMQDMKKYSYAPSNNVSGSLSVKAKEDVAIIKKGEAVVYYSYGANWGPIQDILLKYGLHPNQFPYLLWQLVPYSFMIDWFVDVGSWVRAISPKWGFEVHGCSASQKTYIRSTRTAQWEVKPTATSAVLLEQNFPGDNYISERIDRREQTLSGAIPRLKPEIALSIQQQCDLLSVLLQRALNQRRH